MQSKLNCCQLYIDLKNTDSKIYKTKEKLFFLKHNILGVSSEYRQLYLLHLRLQYCIPKLPQHVAPKAVSVEVIWEHYKHNFNLWSALNISPAAEQPAVAFAIVVAGVAVAAIVAIAVVVIAAVEAEEGCLVASEVPFVVALLVAAFAFGRMLVVASSLL